MGFFNVDKSKCASCGACVNDCPLKILEIDQKQNFPLMIGRGEELCIKCGHCVAVCPNGAIFLEPMPLSACRKLNADWRIPPDKLEQFLKGRRSIRSYKAEPVERQVLEKLIDIARFAPSGINRQPAYWAILCEKEKVARLSGIIIEWMRGQVAAGSSLADSFRMKNIIAAWERKQDWICRGSPNLIICYGLKDDLTAPQACTIALAYLELAAVSFGLGACWAGYAAMAINMCPEARKFTGISNKANCFGAMMAGYPEVNYSRIPSRNKAPVKYI